MEGTAWFLLSTFSKMLEERDRLREGLLSKKDDLGNSQPIQIVKDTKSRRHSQESCSGEKAKDVTG